MQKSFLPQGISRLCMTLGLFAISLFVSAKGPTQDLSKTIISYKISHASLKQAFRKIEAATRLNFSYRTDDVLRYTDISFSSPGISVEKLLNALLANTDLGYTQLNNNIIIKRSTVESQIIPEQIVSIPSLETGIHGKITNEKGEPLAGASISVEGQQKGAAADASGEFSISGLAPGSYTLVISAVGYATERRTIATHVIFPKPRRIQCRGRCSGFRDRSHD